MNEGQGGWGGAAAAKKEHSRIEEMLLTAAVKGKGGKCFRVILVFKLVSSVFSCSWCFQLICFLSFLSWLVFLNTSQSN